MRITPIRSVWKLMSRRVPSLQYFHTSFSSAMLSGVWNSSTDAPSRASSWTKTFILKSPQLQVLEARRSNRLQAKCLLTGNERMRFPVSAKIDAVSAGAITGPPISPATPGICSPGISKTSTEDTSEEHTTDPKYLLLISYDI